MKTRFAQTAMLLATVSMAPLSWAEPFTVSQIRVIGGEKVGEQTVKAYLAVTAGQTVDLQASGNNLVKSVYGSGLFEDVQISRDGNDLVLTVVQRSVINSIDMKGYRQIGKDVLDATLRQIDMQPGRPLNRAVLDKLRKRIAQIYGQRGYYQASVNVETAVAGADRTDVVIDIDEGKRAKIKRFDISGNTVFSQKKLLKQLSSGPSANFFSSRGVFIKEKIQEDLRALVKYYRDHGYADIEVVNADISMNDDRSEAYVDVAIKEGAVYNFGQVQAVGNTVPPAAVERISRLSSSGRFSQQAVLDMRDEVEEMLGERGYAFAKIDIEPSVNRGSGVVDFRVTVDPGQPKTIRFINFSGNHSTNDRTLRLEMRQGEGELFNPAKLRLSKKRLMRLVYIDDVTMDVKPVNGQPNLVDVVVAVNEGLSGDFLFSGGYGSDGWILGGSVSRKNVFGTGQEISAKVDFSESSKKFSLTHHNPYLTEKGVSQTLTASVIRNDTTKTDTSADWIQNLTTLGASYGIPISEFGYVNVGGRLVDTDFTKTTGTPTEVAAELDKFGTDFTYGELNLGVGYDDRDSLIFPSEGQKHNLNLEMATGENIKFTKLSYDGSAYLPLSDNLVASGRVGVASGSGQGDRDSLPFFERFYTGGIRTVRGFRTNSLGPRFAGSTQPKGGDFRANASVALNVMAPEAVSDKMRLSVFVDAGNVYEDASAFEASDMRSSAGVGVVWVTPVGPLTFSYAEPIESHADDKLQAFQFSIGNAF